MEQLGSDIYHPQGSVCGDDCVASAKAVLDPAGEVQPLLRHDDGIGA